MMRPTLAQMSAPIMMKKMSSPSEEKERAPPFLWATSERSMLRQMRMMSTSHVSGLRVKKQKRKKGKEEKKRDRAGYERAAQ